MIFRAMSVISLGTLSAHHTDRPVILRLITSGFGKLLRTACLTLASLCTTSKFATRRSAAPPTRPSSPLQNTYKAKSGMTCGCGNLATKTYTYTLAIDPGVTIGMALAAFFGGVHIETFHAAHCTTS
jgi:hypothetical protein